MNEVTIKNKEKATNAIKEYRKSLLKEFLLVAEKLKKELNNLCKTGIDEEEFICLDGVETEQDICYTVLNSKMVLEFLNVLNKMNDENAMRLFEGFTNTYKYNDFCYYQEWNELEELLYADINAKNAEDFINIR